MNNITSKSKELQKGKKFKINKFAAGVALISSVTIGSVLYAIAMPKHEGKKQIIIPTPTPTPIETITPTPTAIPTKHLGDEDNCVVQLVSYYTHSGDNLTQIVDDFYGEIIDKYNINGEEKEYIRVQQKLIDVLATINKTDRDKIPADRPIFILAPADITTDNMYTIFSKNSEFYEDDYFCIHFVKSKEEKYDPSIETTDGMVDSTTKTNRLIPTIDYFDVSDEGYFTVNAYKYIVGENFDLYKFIKDTYTENLLSVGLTGGDIQHAYNHIADSIIKLNPSKFSVYSELKPGDEFIVLNPNSISEENYKFVLYETPTGYDAQRNRISYYVYSILQEMQSKGRTY